MLIVSLAAALALSAAPAPAATSPDSPCLGSAANVGDQITGTVLHVVDGERLCLASGPTPDSWTELRINTVYVHQAGGQDEAFSRAALMSVAFGKKLSCRIKAAPDGATIADCRINGERLAALMSAPGAEVAAAAWVQPAPRSTRTVLRMAAR